MTNGIRTHYRPFQARLLVYCHQERCCRVNDEFFRHVIDTYGLCRRRRRRCLSQPNNRPPTLYPPRINGSSCHHPFRRPLGHRSRAGVQDVSASRRCVQRRCYAPGLPITCFASRVPSTAVEQFQCAEGLMWCRGRVVESKLECTFCEMGKSRGIERCKSTHQSQISFRSNISKEGFESGNSHFATRNAGNVRLFPLS